MTDKNTNTISRRAALKNMGLLSAFVLNPFGKVLPSKTDKPLHFIGLGGAGTNGIVHIYQMGIKGRYTAISSPVREGLPNDFQFILFESPKFPHLKYDGDLCKNILDFQKELQLAKEIESVFDADEQFVLCAGLGGGSGTSLALNLADFLLKEKKTYLLICSLPFKNEGPYRRGIALEALAKLSKYEACRFLDIEDILLEYSKVRYSEAFNIADMKFYETFLKHQNINK